MLVWVLGAIAGVPWGQTLVWVLGAMAGCGGSLGPGIGVGSLVQVDSGVGFHCTIFVSYTKHELTRQLHPFSYALRTREGNNLWWC